MNDPRPYLDKATARRLAVGFDLDPRSVQRAYQGLPVRGMAGERARQAIASWLAEQAQRAQPAPHAPQTTTAAPKAA